jgi:TPR repeat protein
MPKISATLSTAVITMTLLSFAPLSSAENRTPTPEEFKELVRKYNESGASPVLQRQPQLPKGAEEFNRAVALHTKKNPSAKELKEAAALYQTALDAGIVQASTNLALLYLDGKGVKKDVKKALTLLNSASAKNETQADLTLARLYLNGTDVKRDEKKGEALLNKAAKTGNPNATKMLADYKEWKKKNELAMKEYQELMKKMQLTQVKPGGTSLQPLQIMPQPPAALQFPVIPGYAYVSDRKPSMPNFLAPQPQKPLQPLNILPQGGATPPPLKVEQKPQTPQPTEPTLMSPAVQ